jgi:hypothetical protein
MYLATDLISLLHRQIAKDCHTCRRASLLHLIEFSRELRATTFGERQPCEVRKGSEETGKAEAKLPRVQPHRSGKFLIVTRQGHDTRRSILAMRPRGSSAQDLGEHLRPEHRRDRKGGIGWHRTGR